MKQSIPTPILMMAAFLVTILGELGLLSPTRATDVLPYAVASVGLMTAIYLSAVTGPWRAGLMIASQIFAMLALGAFSLMGLDVAAPTASQIIITPLEPLAVASAINYMWRWSNKRTLPSITAVYLVGTIAISLIFAAARLALPHQGGPPDGLILSRLAHDWLSHALGYILFGPLLLSISIRARRTDTTNHPMRIWLSTLVFGIQLVVLAVALAGHDLIAQDSENYSHHPWLLLLATPLPIFAAFQLGFRHSLMITCLSGIAVLWLTYAGLGPFVSGRGLAGSNDLRLMIITGAMASMMLAALATRLDHAVANARRADAAKRQFLASIGHEMRSSLTGVIGAAELLKNEMPEDADPQDRLGLIERSGVLLTRLVEDTLEYAAIGRDGVELSPVNFSLESAARDVITIFEPALRDKGVDLVLDIDPDEEHRIFADGARMRQIMINLVSNASKFTTNGEVRLSIRTRPMGGRWVVCEVEVADTGPGVPADRKEKIFDAFQKSGSSAGGLGLGLAISRDIAIAMRGSISVYDNPKGGAIFRFKCVVERMREGERSESGLSPLADSERRSYSILVAEDNHAGRIVMKAMLSAAGMDVTTVEDGARAVDAIKDRSYDLILMDMHMPGMSGPAAIAAIRNFENGERKTPILVVTGGDAGEDALMEEGVVAGVLNKPLSAERLIGAVTAALSHNGGGTEPPQLG